jgi:protein SCO1/2
MAILIPLTAYFIVKQKSEHAILMPRHYLPDSVTSITRHGKQVIDTTWHRIGDFSLVNQEGTIINWDSLKGKIVVDKYETPPRIYP